MDISATTEPKSDQQNFDDYIGGPKTVTITEVKQGSTEQPVEIHLVEFPGRPYKPSKSMRRVLVTAWGVEALEYGGREMTLYGDATVKFGPNVVGGIKISHLSHIPKAFSVNLTTSRGKREPFTVQPLHESYAAHVASLSASTSLDELLNAWQQIVAAGVSSVPELVKLKDARKAKLSAS
jgi:hypothetical protein